MRVNKPDHDDPSCLDPPEPGELDAAPAKKRAARKKAPSGQGSLF
jgi:hypothetical protein